MSNPKSIKELLKAGGPRLGALEARARSRSMALDLVRAALPPDLAAVVVTAGIDDGRLTIGASSAAWASRLRYAADSLRAHVGAASGQAIGHVRIKVVPVGEGPAVPPRGAGA